MIIKKKRRVIKDVNVEVRVLPLLTPGETTSYFRSLRTSGFFPKQIGFIPRNKVYSQSGYNIAVFSRDLLKKEFAKGDNTLKNLVFKCICCNKTLATVDLAVQEHQYVNKWYFQSHVQYIEHRFVNGNKRSAKFAILVHEGCKELVELNPLSYIEPLKEEAQMYPYNRSIIVNPTTLDRNPQEGEYDDEEDDDYYP